MNGMPPRVSLAAAKGCWSPSSAPRALDRMGKPSGAPIRPPRRDDVVVAVGRTARTRRPVPSGPACEFRHLPAVFPPGLEPAHLGGDPDRVDPVAGVQL